jgi:hypothetical protein
MKNKKIVIIAVACITAILIGAVAYASDVLKKQSKYDEENHKSLIMDDYLDYIKSNKETDYNKTLADIPMYSFEEIIRNNYDCGILLGRDAGFYTDRSNTRRDYASIIFTVFPTKAIRESEDKEYVYAIYDTDLGMRVFMFFSKEKNNYNTLDGFPILMNKSLNYKDFSNIKIGDKASHVESIDPIISEYVPTFDRFADDRLMVYTKKGAGPTSVHLLKDGILKIEYKRINLGDYEITDIEYNEDFILSGFNGDTCYKIAEIDYVDNK